MKSNTAVQEAPGPSLPCFQRAAPVSPGRRSWRVELGNRGPWPGGLRPERRGKYMGAAGKFGVMLKKGEAAEVTEFFKHSEGLGLQSAQGHLRP